RNGTLACIYIENIINNDRLGGRVVELFLYNRVGLVRDSGIAYPIHLAPAPRKRIRRVIKSDRIVYRGLVARRLSFSACYHDGWVHGDNQVCGRTGATICRWRKHVGYVYSRVGGIY